MPGANVTKAWVAHLNALAAPAGQKPDLPLEIFTFLSPQHGRGDCYHLVSHCLCDPQVNLAQVCIEAKFAFILNGLSDGKKQDIAAGDAMFGELLDFLKTPQFSLPFHNKTKDKPFEQHGKAVREVLDQDPDWGSRAKKEAQKQRRYLHQVGETRWLIEYDEFVDRKRRTVSKLVTLAVDELFEVTRMDNPRPGSFGCPRLDFHWYARETPFCRVTGLSDKSLKVTYGSATAPGGGVLPPGFCLKSMQASEDGKPIGENMAPGAGPEYQDFEFVSDDAYNPVVWGYKTNTVDHCKEIEDGEIVKLRDPALGFSEKPKVSSAPSPPKSAGGNNGEPRDQTEQGNRPIPFSWLIAVPSIHGVGIRPQGLYAARSTLRQEGTAASLHSICVPCTGLRSGASGLHTYAMGLSDDYLLARRAPSLGDFRHGPQR